MVNTGRDGVLINKNAILKHLDVASGACFMLTLSDKRESRLPEKPPVTWKVQHQASKSGQQHVSKSVMGSLCA